jgi:hypothetical protein
MASVFENYNPMGLFNPIAGQGTQVGRGSLISFSYPMSMSREQNIIHDPTPMVIISDVKPTYIRGVNLHYLTVPYVKTFLIRNSRNPNFNYATSIKPDKYLADSFRMYYFGGMKQKRKLDMTFLMQILTAVRNFSPTELQRIRNELKQQIQQRLQVKATELNAYTEWQNRMRQPIPQPTLTVPQPIPTPIPQAPPPQPVQPVQQTTDPNGQR